MLCRCGFRLCGGFEGDPVAHGGELGDVVAHPAFEVDAAGVVVGSGLGHRRGAGQQGPAVPDPDRDPRVRQVRLGPSRAEPG